MSLPDAFSIDERYDRVHASNGRSRYGVYLAKSAAAFHNGDDVIRDTASFAATALSIALPPVMDPPYAAAHRRVLGAWTHQDDDGRVAIGVALAAPLPPGAVSVLGWHWRSWQNLGTSGRYGEPAGNDRPAAYTQLTLRVPLNPRRLPDPRYGPRGKPRLDTAKEAVHLAVVQLNGALGELLGTLATRRAA